MGQMWNFLPGYGIWGNPDGSYPGYQGYPGAYPGTYPGSGGPNGFYGRQSQPGFYGNPGAYPNGSFPPGFFPTGAYPPPFNPAFATSYLPPGVSPDVLNWKETDERNVKEKDGKQSDGPKAANEPSGKELLEEAKSAQSEVQSDNKSGGGGGDGGARNEGMKAVGILMQVAGIVMSMDMIAMALQVTGFILNATGMALEAAGTAMDASGMAMIASGQALCSNPFTAAAGAAMIAAGTALKVTGNAMKITGKALKILGKVMEKTAKALQKALKVLMRGAKSMARNALNKMRSMKKAGADKMMRMRQAKAAKLKDAGKTDKATKMEKKANHWKSVSTKTETKIQKSRTTVAQSREKNRAAMQNLKTETKADITKGGQAAKAMPSKAKANAKKQWNEAGLTKGSNYGPKTSAKGAYKQSKQKFQESWKSGTKRPDGTSRFSETRTQMKTEWGKLKTDFKGQFRTPKAEKPKAPAKPGQSADDLATTPKTKPTESKPPSKADLKLDPKTEAKLNKMKTGDFKAAPAKPGRSADDLATTPKTKPTESTPPSKADLKLNPKTEAKLNEMKAAENATRFDKIKAARWGASGVAIGVGAGLVSEANASGGEEGNDPLMYRDRFDNWEDWHRYYDPIMQRANGDPYRSGYYDERWLAPYPYPYSYPMYPNQNQGPTYYYNDSVSHPLSKDLQTQA